MAHAALPAEYGGPLRMVYCNDAERACQVRAGLGLLPPVLVDFICKQGVQFAVLSRRSRPSRAIAEWYPYRDESTENPGRRLFDHAAGWYDPRARLIAVTRSSNPVRTVIHEVGHAIDHLLWQGSRVDVQRHYRRGRAVTAYGETNAAEFWAEAFRVVYHPGALAVEGRDAAYRANPELLETIEALPQLIAR
jgi:hypothetical protein